MNSAARLSAACAIIVIFSIGAPAQQKPCLTASKFGPDDQIGNLCLEVAMVGTETINPIAIRYVPLLAIVACRYLSFCLLTLARLGQLG